MSTIPDTASSMNNDQWIQMIMSMTGSSKKAAIEHFRTLNLVADISKINSSERRTAFLAQVIHESAGFSKNTELYSSTPENLFVLVKKAGRLDKMGFKTTEDAKKFFGEDGKLDRDSFDNKFYEFPHLGLGNNVPGDGSKYIGRGWPQLTGKDAYSGMTDYTKEHYDEIKKYWTDKGEIPPSIDSIDFVKNPKMLAEPPFAGLAAGYEWDRKNLNALADKLDMSKGLDSEKNKKIFDEISTKVNGGSVGKKERRELWEKARGMDSMILDKNILRPELDKLKQNIIKFQQMIRAGKVNGVSTPPTSSSPNMFTPS